jgi:hypothetical protein
MNHIYIYIIIVFSVIALKIRGLNIVFRTLNTFLHETSHGLVASILRCDVKKINHNDNASGSCSSVSKSRIVNFFVLLAGYTSCAIIPYVLFVLVFKDYAFLVLTIIVIVAVLTLFLWIKNKFGRIWTIFFIAINVFFILYPYLYVWQGYLVIFYAILIAVDNFFSCITLLKLAWNKPKSAGDATLLQKTTKISAKIWAIVFCILSLWFIYKISIMFILP